MRDVGEWHRKTGRPEDRKTGRFQDGTEQIISALIEVHRCLGPGSIESAYEACSLGRAVPSSAELSERRLRFERRRPLPIKYKRVYVECGYRLDLVVDDRILLELKVVERLLPIHEARVVTYLRLSHLAVGLLVNFNSTTLARRPATAHA